MDTRTGETYRTEDEALQAGVPPGAIQKVRIITKGPFKGRIYEETPAGGLGPRRKDLERKRQAAAVRRTELNEKERMIHAKPHYPIAADNDSE